MYKKIILIFLILLSVNNVSADTIKNYPWGDKIVYDDGAFEINQHGQNYQTWEGVWENKNLMEAGTTHYPYLIMDDGTQWTLTKNGEFFTLPKNSIYLYSFNPYHIGMTITVTPTQLNSISTYQNVAGNNTWYIVIPDQIINKVKVFNWDNKLPGVKNQDGVLLNQSNFEYHKVGNEIRFYYNQDARDFGIVSSEITFKFDSWYVVQNSTNWESQIILDSNSTIVQATNNIEIQDSVSNYVSKWRFDNSSLLDENTTNSNDVTNYGATYTASGILAGGYVFDSGDYIDAGASNALISDNEYLSIMAWINYSSLHTGTYVENRVITLLESAVSTNIALGITNEGNIAGFTRSGTTAIQFLGGTVDTGNNHVMLVKNGSSHQLYLNGVPSGSPVEYTPANNLSSNPATIGKDTATGVRFFNGIIDDVRIYDRALSSSEISQIYNNSHYIIAQPTTTIQNATTGNVVQKIGNNGTFADGIVSVNLQINSSADNSSWTGWYTVQSNVTTGTMYDVSVGYQNQYYQVRAVLSTTNASQTPIITNIRSLIGSAAAGAPSNITSWSNNVTNDNSLDITINISKLINFNTTANQTIVTWNWYKDDIDQSHNYDNITLSWLSLGNKTVKVNATNSNGISNTIQWNITINLLPPQNLTSVLEQTYINFDWNDYLSADYWNVSELHESIPYLNTSIILDGVKDNAYDCCAHGFIMYSANPTSNTDYESILLFRNSTHLIGYAQGWDDDNLNNDDHFLIGIDGENNNLTNNDRKFILNEDGSTGAKRWSESTQSWLPTSTDSIGAVVGGGVAGQISYEMIVPISEIVGFVDNATIKFYMERECSYLNPTVETFYPLDLINSTDAAIWKSVILTDGEVYNYIGNTSISEFNSTGLDIFSWYKHQFITINDSTESSPIYSVDITADIHHFTVSGYIKDTLGNIVSGATVWAANGHVMEATQSDINGYYEGVSFHTDNYTIYGNKSGYQENFTDVYVNGNLTNINVTLTAYTITDWEIYQQLLLLESQNNEILLNMSINNTIVNDKIDTILIFILLNMAVIVGIIMGKRGKNNDK